MDENITTITITPGGSYRVEGNFEILDSNGNIIPLTECSVELCSCGKAKNKKFCDKSGYCATQKECNKNLP